MSLNKPATESEAKGRTVQLKDGRIGIVQSVSGRSGKTLLNVWLIGYDMPHTQLPKMLPLTAVQAAEARTADHVHDVNADEVLFFPASIRVGKLDMQLVAEGDRILRRGIPVVVRKAPALMSDGLRYEIEVEGERYETLENEAMLVLPAPGHSVPARNESIKVPVDEIGPVYRGIPTPGQFILVPNAGGAHQSPGSYGYTRTEVLAVNTRGDRDFTTRSVSTWAYPGGGWTTGDYLICGAEPRA